MTGVRVAAVQLEATEDVAANLDACLRLVDEAAAQGARLIVLPEFCNHLSWYRDRAHAHEVATRPGDEFLTAIAQRAARLGVFIKVNVTHAYGDGRTGGTNFLFSDSGTILGSCDKQVLMGAENDFLNPAAEVGPVVATELGRLGMYACMEGVISEVARGLALRGAQVLLNSLNSFATDEASLHIPVRAAENHVWVVAANKIGPLLPAALLPEIAARLGVPPEWLHGAGESQIVAPDGTVVAKGPRTGEAVVIADIDPEAADRGRARILSARKPHLYGPLAEPPRLRSEPGAAELPVAVVRDETKLAQAIADGARLVVLAPGVSDVDTTVGSLKDGTHAVVTPAGSGVSYLVGPDGVVGVQREGEAPQPFDLPWGRLAIIGGEDSIVPEHFRLAAIADVDVVAVPFIPRQEWELALGLPERSAENRMNLIAATPAGGEGAIYALSADFTLWTQWQGPFTGRISHPLITSIDPDQPVAHAVVYPAQAANRLVSRNTDLVGGRPWRLMQALLEER